MWAIMRLGMKKGVELPCDQKILISSSFATRQQKGKLFIYGQSWERSGPFVSFSQAFSTSVPTLKVGGWGEKVDFLATLCQTIMVTLFMLFSFFFLPCRWRNHKKHLSPPLWF